MSVKNRVESSREQLARALRALELEDLRGASGRAWAATVEITKAFAESKRLPCVSKNDVYRIALDLADEVGNKELGTAFDWAGLLDSNSREGYLDEYWVELGIKNTTQFVDCVADYLTFGARTGGRPASSSN